MSTSFQCQYLHQVNQASDFNTQLPGSDINTKTQSTHTL
jgi:hypothetical protein